MNNNAITFISNNFTKYKKLAFKAPASLFRNLAFLAISY